MKDEEEVKGAGKEPSAEPTEEPNQLNRGEFLKTVGVGVAAAGLGMLAGGPSSAHATPELDSSRAAVQKLMRALLESPLKAKDFLDSPQAVAEEFGVYLSDDDAKTIQETLKKLTTEIALREGHDQTSYKDDVKGHFNWYNKVVKPIQKESDTTAPRPPGGTKRK